MTKIGFIGLGIMGAPMACNLVKAGFDVVGYNRTPARVAALASQGVLQADSIAELSAGSDVVITMLPDSPDVESVFFGSDGVLANLPPSGLFVDMSTIRPDVAVSIARSGREEGVDVLDAPVSGGEAGAVEGSLSIIVGGESAAFDRARPVFAAMGRTVVHVGPAGSGQTVKAANQLMVAANIQGLAEALVLLEAHGVELSRAVEALGGGLAGSTVLGRKADGMIARSFAPGFRLDLFDKDMGIVQAAARDKGVTTLLASVVGQVIGSLVRQGHGDLDHSAMIKVVDQLSKSRAGSS